MLDDFGIELVDGSNSDDVQRAESKWRYWLLHLKLFLNQALRVFDFCSNFQEEFEAILQLSEQALFFTHFLHFQLFHLQKVSFLLW